MPVVDSNTTTALGDDYMEDDLFDYNAEISDIDISTRAPTAPAEKKDTLGIDEEVKIRRKRVTVKLDEERYILNITCCLLVNFVNTLKAHVKPGNTKIETGRSEKTQIQG